MELWKKVQSSRMLSFFAQRRSLHQCQSIINSRHATSQEEHRNCRSHQRRRRHHRCQCNYLECIVVAESTLSHRSNSSKTHKHTSHDMGNTNMACVGGDQPDSHKQSSCWPLNLFRRNPFQKTSSIEKLPNKSQFELADHEIIEIHNSREVYFRGTFEELDLFIQQSLLHAESVISLHVGTLQLDALCAYAEDSRVLPRILQALVSCVGYHDAFHRYAYVGPYLITLFLQSAPLENEKKLWPMLLENFEAEFEDVVHHAQDNTVIKHRNICVMFGFYAEKFFNLRIDKESQREDKSSILAKIVQFLINIVLQRTSMTRTLFALICIEKLAQNYENKKLIGKMLKQKNVLPVLVELEDFILEKNTQNAKGADLYYMTSESLLRYQVAFCAQWLLDNHFMQSGRKLTYETVDSTQMKAILNVNDKSENMKLSANGFMARCDSSTFEWARATFPVTRACFYYEVVLLTGGLMQIGWSNDETRFIAVRTGDELGVGDDCNSVGFDGSRKLVWFDGKEYPVNMRRSWRAGDVLGCLINKDKGKLTFYINQRQLISIDSSITGNSFFIKPYYATASLTAFQQCYFNFGQVPFKYPPKGKSFHSFHDSPDVESSHLSSDDYKILPLHIRARQDSKSSCLTSLSSWSPTKQVVCGICYTQSVMVRCDSCRKETCSDCLERWRVSQQNEPGSNYPTCPYCIQKLSASSIA